nr:hypothetical protein Iba_chr06cCG15040 [Ipomoea batatas]
MVGDPIKKYEKILVPVFPDGRPRERCLLLGDPYQMVLPLLESERNYLYKLHFNFVGHGNSPPILKILLERCRTADLPASLEDAICFFVTQVNIIFMAYS